MDGSRMLPEVEQDRAVWVAEAARRSFVLAPTPDLRALPELFVDPCPRSIYVNPKDVTRIAAAELHAVGVYEGAPGEDGTTSSSEGGAPGPESRTVQIRVCASAAPVVLFLMSYRSVLWEVEVDDDAILGAVFLSSYEPSAVRCAVPLVAVTSVAGGPHVYSLEADEDGEGEDRDAADLGDAIRIATNLPLASFQGEYYGTSFTVPFCKDAALARRVIAEHGRRIAHHRARPPAPFHVIHEGAVVRYGTRDEPVPLPDLLLNAVVYCDVEQRFYGITSHELFAFDERGGVERIVPEGCEDLSWLGGIAYDAQRGRLLIGTLWHTGVHHLYELATGTWRTVPMEQVGPVQGLAYEPQGDVVYAVRAGALLALSPDLDRGTPVHPLREATFAAFDTVGWQMAAFPDDVVLCRHEGGIGARAFFTPEAPPPIARGWIVHLPTGQLRLLDLDAVRPRRPLPATPPEVPIELAFAEPVEEALEPEPDFDDFVSVHELRRNAAEVVTQVARTGRPLTLRTNHDLVMLVAYRQHHGQVATVEEVTCPDWQERLARARREIAAHASEPTPPLARHRRGLPHLGLTPQAAEDLAALRADTRLPFDDTLLMQLDASGEIPLGGPLAGFHAATVRGLRVVWQRVGDERWIAWIRALPEGAGAHETSPR